MQGEIVYRLAVLGQLAESVSKGIKELESLDAEKTLEKRICQNGIVLEEEVKKFEIWLIRYALFHSKGNQTKAANLLTIKTSTLNSKMKRYGISASKIASPEV